MTAVNTELWLQFDEVDRRRRGKRRQQEAAFRQLDVSASSVDDADSLRAWQDYCQATQALAECVAEIESLVWQLSR